MFFQGEITHEVRHIYLYDIYVCIIDVLFWPIIIIC